MNRFIKLALLSVSLLISSEVLTYPIVPIRVYVHTDDQIPFLAKYGFLEIKNSDSEMTIYDIKNALVNLGVKYTSAQQHLFRKLGTPELENDWKLENIEYVDFYDPYYTGRMDQMGIFRLVDQYPITLHLMIFQ